MVHYRCYKICIGKFKNFFFLKGPIENARIGIAYTNAFESAGIGLLNYIHSRPIQALLKALV